MSSYGSNQESNARIVGMDGKNPDNKLLACVDASKAMQTEKASAVFADNIVDLKNAEVICRYLREIYFLSRRSELLEISLTWFF